MERIIFSGKKLARERKKRHLSIEKFCSEIGNGLTVKEVESWEKGKNRIPLKYYQQLSDIFGNSIMDELEVIPVPLKKIFLHAFLEYSNKHNGELGYGDLHDDDSITNAILEVANSAVKNGCKNSRKLILAPPRNTRDTINGTATASGNGVAVGNDFSGGAKCKERIEAISNAILDSDMDDASKIKALRIIKEIK